MRQVKQKKLEKNGWRVSSASTFLGLSPEDQAFIEMKISLSQSLKEMRRNKNLSQLDFAKEIRSSQSRVAKMESGSATVSIDLLIKALLALGATPKDLAKTISSKSGVH